MDYNNVEIRIACPDDYDEYYQMRSEKKNMFWTGYVNPPNYEKFREWFINRINDPARKIYLMYVDDVCIGSLNIDYYDTYAMIGYSIKEAYEGRGFATFLINEAKNLVKQNKEFKVNEISAWINSANIGSIKAIEKNSFKKTDVSESRLRFGKNEIYNKYTVNIK